MRGEVRPVSPRADPGLTGRQPRAVQSALRVLEEVARVGAGATAGDVVQGLGLPPATVYRLLNLLVAEEYLVRLPDVRGFALGRRVSALLGDTLPVLVPTAAREVLSELRGQVRGAVSLVRYSATALRVVNPDPDVPGPDDALLARHLHASSAGKLLLAEQPHWREVFPEHRLHRLTEHTITRPTSLDRHLDDVRVTGCSVTIAELLPALACAAVPVRSSAGDLVASLTLTGTTERAEALRAHLPRLRVAASRLAPLLA